MNYHRQWFGQCQRAGLRTRQTAEPRGPRYMLHGVSSASAHTLACMRVAFIWGACSWQILVASRGSLWLPASFWKGQRPGSRLAPLPALLSTHESPSGVWHCGNAGTHISSGTGSGRTKCSGNLNGSTFMLCASPTPSQWQWQYPLHVPASAKSLSPPSSSTNKERAKRRLGMQYAARSAPAIRHGCSLMPHAHDAPPPPPHAPRHRFPEALLRSAQGWAYGGSSQPGATT